MNNKKSIIHISFDYPDCINSKKTKAVYNLIKTQNKYHNIVFSLNRTANPFSNFSYRKEPHGFTLNVFGLPYGIGLNIFMHFAFKKILKILKIENIDCHLIHAHKLTFEGIIAYNLSKIISKSFIVTVRGHTDIRVLSYKLFLKRKYLNIIQQSQQTIFLAPWTEKILQKIFQKNYPNNKSSILPNIINLNIQNPTNSIKYNNKFLSVFNIDFYKIKNIEKTINAIDLIHKDFPEIGLDIIGGGNSHDKVQSIIDNCRYPHQFRMLGAKKHEEVISDYIKYLGLILPSYPETFGMVYIEALNSGIPIVYSQNSGVDGYFDDYKIGEKVNHKSTTMIAESILKIFKNNNEYSQEVLNLKNNGGLAKFSKKSISKQYDKILTSAIK